MNVDGHVVVTSIWKSPVEGRLPVRGVNVEGDDQADRTVHGGPDKAVYSYGAEDTEWWEAELGRPLGPGAFGENLTVRGMPVSGALIGERWRIGTVLLEVAQPRVPCYKLGVRMGDRLFPKKFARRRAAGRVPARSSRRASWARATRIEVVAPARRTRSRARSCRAPFCASRSCSRPRSRRPSCARDLRYWLIERAVGEGRAFARAPARAARAGSARCVRSRPRSGCR